MAITYRYPHPAVTTDIVIFTIRNHELKVLLIKRALPPHKGEWALPGGSIRLEEGLEECARRELEEETGVSGVYLEQLYSFGKPDRDPRERVITVAYYALIPSDKLKIKAASDAAGTSWFGMQELPELAFDHQEILKLAQQRLVAKLDYSTIALQFMPQAFTLSELQQVYELISGEPVDKRNFRKRIPKPQSDQGNRQGAKGGRPPAGQVISRHQPQPCPRHQIMSMSPAEQANTGTLNPLAITYTRSK